MRIRHVISLELGDTARTAKLEDAYRSLGGHTIEDDAWQKPYRRIRSNEFTRTEARTAVAQLKALAEKCLAEEPPFPEGPVRDTWVQGRSFNTARAVEAAERFLEDLQQDLETLARSDLPDT